MNCSCIVFIGTVTLSTKERWPSVFITRSVCSFLPDGSNCSFCLTCRLPPHDHLAISLWWKKMSHTRALFPVSKKGGGRVGGEITLEVTTWICLPINLITFVSPSSPSLHNLCLPDATFGLGNPAICCVLFYVMTKPEDESLREFASVLPKQSLQGQKGQDRRGRMCVVTYGNHIGFNVT